jgi:hypothetical protein
MDLRYLEFLLATYSWIAIVFCGVLLIWAVRVPITEVQLFFVKIKTEIWFRKIIVVFALWLLPYSLNSINQKITDEIQNLQQQQYVNIPYFSVSDLDKANSRKREDDARRASIKKQWEALYDKLTHSINTMAFAFIRYNPETNNLTESTVQTIIMYVMMYFPLLFIIFEGCIVTKSIMVDVTDDWWIRPMHERPVLLNVVYKTRTER